MPYLAVDLDAKAAMPRVARAAECSPGDVAWALLELWEHAWRTSNAEVSQVTLFGCVGTDSRMVSALETFGFIEKKGELFRICGAEKYLRVRAARRAGAEKTNSRARSERSTEQSTARSTVRSTARSTSRSARSTVRSTERSEGALTASSEQRMLRLPSVDVRGDAVDVKQAGKPDARHQPLVTALVAAGASFEARNARDVTRLLALATQGVGHDAAHDEVLARWRRALGRSGYPTVRSLSELATHWGHFGPPRDITMPDWSDPATGGTPDANGDIKF